MEDQSFAYCPFDSYKFENEKEGCKMCKRTKKEIISELQAEKKPKWEKLTYKKQVR